MSCPSWSYHSCLGGDGFHEPVQESHERLTLRTHQHHRQQVDEAKENLGQPAAGADTDDGSTTGKVDARDR